MPRTMAGTAGFEPAMWESKSHALTTWLRPFSTDTEVAGYRNKAAVLGLMDGHATVRR